MPFLAPPKSNEGTPVVEASPKLPLERLEINIQSVEIVFSPDFLRLPQVHQDVQGLPSVFGGQQQSRRIDKNRQTKLGICTIPLDTGPEKP